VRSSIESRRSLLSAVLCDELAVLCGMSAVLCCISTVLYGVSAVLCGVSTVLDGVEATGKRTSRTEIAEPYPSQVE